MQARRNIVHQTVPKNKKDIYVFCPEPAAAALLQIPPRGECGGRASRRNEQPGRERRASIAKDALASSAARNPIQRPLSPEDLGQVPPPAARREEVVEGSAARQCRRREGVARLPPGAAGATRGARAADVVPGACAGWEGRERA